jgi:hydrogenase maturation factor
MRESNFPTGKLPAELMARIIAKVPNFDPRLVLGPGVGLDCAVIDLGTIMLAFKSDPITFATDEIGWYLVQINSNDIVTTGATPRWLLATVLLPQGNTDADRAEQIADQIFSACRQAEITFLGGHTEITADIHRPIVIGTMVGEIPPGCLITPRGAQPGDHLMLTKGVPVEATAILAREFPDRCRQVLTEQELKQAQSYLYDPGISIRKDAEIAQAAGKVTAMHDPTEGGLATALWELSEASGRSLYFEPGMVYVPPISARLCAAFDLNPLDTIASGALLLTARNSDADQIRAALETNGIRCDEIGAVEDGPVGVWKPGEAGRVLLPRPQRDEIARLFDRS